VSEKEGIATLFYDIRILLYVLHVRCVLLPYRRDVLRHFEEELAFEIVFFKSVVRGDLKH
jgi:hypothetical protein